MDFILHVLVELDFGKSNNLRLKFAREKDYFFPPTPVGWWQVVVSMNRSGFLCLFSSQILLFTKYIRIIHIIFWLMNILALLDNNFTSGWNDLSIEVDDQENTTKCAVHKTAAIFVSGAKADNNKTLSISLPMLEYLDSH